jgi:WD40 repeat protein
VRVWRLSNRSELAPLSVSGTIRDLAFSPDGRLLAATDAEGSVKIWEVVTWRVRKEFRAHLGSVEALAFSTDSQRLVTASDGDEAPRLWDVASWQELITLGRPGVVLEQVAFSTDGNRLLAGTSHGDVLCWLVPSFGEIAAKERSDLPR